MLVTNVLLSLSQEENEALENKSIEELRAMIQN